MTIAAAYVTSEGVVLGADSTTTVSGPGTGVIQLLNHAQKIFEVGEPGMGHMGVSTWGAGKPGNVSHRTLVARLADSIGHDTTVSQAKDTFKALVIAEYQPATEQAGVGYFIGGVSPDTKLPDCWELWFGEKGRIDETQLNVGQAKFAGMPDFFTRAFYGFDTHLPQMLLEGLKKKMAFDDTFNKPFDEVFNNIAGQLAAVGFPDVPIREAIDFVYTYLHITIKASKFRFGPPLCGGPIEIGFVSTDRHFRWVCHKGFESAIEEHGGGMYVQ